MTSKPICLLFSGSATDANRQDRQAIVKAFIAKSLWKFSTTRVLLDYLKSSLSLRRLCGWDTIADIPSEATFSRAFAAFANSKLPQQLHAAIIQAHLSQKLIGHISRDATAIPAREKPIPKTPSPSPELKKKRGRPAKDEPPRPPKPPTRVMLQPNRSLDANLADLPTACNVGCKRNSQGYKESWIGYKLHLDCADGDIPVSAILTSASLHDSQAAIPLAQTTAERVNSNLKDNFGGLFVRVRGHAKVNEVEKGRGDVSVDKAPFPLPASRT
ncbi:MAG: transposase, partial [Planctomycetota bacterium]